MHRILVNRLRLAGGLAALALTLTIAGLAVTSSARTPFMLMVYGALALGAALYAMLGLGRAPCPTCGTYRNGVSLRNNKSMACRECGAYFHSRQGSTHLTADDAIEARPVFATACPTKIVWPPGCCVCQGPVVAHVSVKLEIEADSPIAQDFAVRVATLGTFKLTTKNRYEVLVPVCATHGADDPYDVAELEMNDEEAQLHIRFRSAAYARVFAETNGPVFWDS